MGDILAERLENVNISDKENVRDTHRNDPPSSDGAGNAAVIRELKEMSKKLDTITNTVILMEKRISLVEDQVKILSQSRDWGPVAPLVELALPGVATVALVHVTAVLLVQPERLH